MCHALESLKSLGFPLANRLRMPYMTTRHLLDNVYLSIKHPTCGMTENKNIINGSDVFGTNDYWHKVCLVEWLLIIYLL